MSKQPIARGRTAEIYAWKPGLALKAYRPGFAQEDALYEAEIASQVQAAGIACPRFYEMTEFEGRPALVYERVDAPTMADLVFQKPWRIPQLARRMARLQWEMHTPVIESDLPLQRERYIQRLETSRLLPGDLKKALLKRLSTLPDDRRLCHGDFHPGNILTLDERDLTIDWVDASLGHPLADVARTSILLLGTSATVRNPLIKGIVKWFHKFYLEAYFAHVHTPSIFGKVGSHFGETGLGPEEVYHAFLPIVAAARLTEGIPELQGWLLAQASRV